jgi:alpha-galactosidase
MDMRRGMSKNRSAPWRRSVRILALVVGLAASGLTATATSVALTAAPAHADSASSVGARPLDGNNSLGATPLMGWSNWSYIGDDPTTAKIEAQAAALKSSGLLAAGYQYVNVDDFYYLCNSNGPEVDANGRWATDPGKFPSSGSTPGMEVLGNYIHGLGEKFGMYVTPGIAQNAVTANSPIAGTSYTADEIATTTTETNYNCKHMVGLNYSSPGAQDFINSWADELASWGVDYVKIDGVGSSDIADVQAWSTALKQTGRPMWLELSNELPIANASTWHSLANSWRTTGDIECYCWPGGVNTTNPVRTPLTSWANVSLRFASAASWAPDESPGGWADFDSLEVGNGTADDGLTDPEAQSTMTLWSMAGSNLVLGTDLTSLNSTELGYLKNSAVISVDQDGAAAGRIVDSGNGQVFSKRESDGDYVIALYNTSATATTTVSVPLSAAGISGSVTATNLWTGASVGAISGTYSVSLGPGAVQLIRTNGGGASASGEEVHAVGAGRCLDVPQPTSTEAPEGTQVQIYDCNGGVNQLWTHTSANQLTVYGGADCLDVANQSTANSAVVDIWPCNGGANQQWTVNSNGTITGVGSGKCLDVNEADTANGSLVDIYTCNGQSNQQWTVG